IPMSMLVHLISGFSPDKASSTDTIAEREVAVSRSTFTGFRQARENNRASERHKPFVARRSHTVLSIVAMQSNSKTLPTKVASWCRARKENRVGYVAPRSF